MCNNKHHYKHISVYERLKFKNGEGRIDFPNGFTIVVRNNSYGELEGIAVQDAPNDFKNIDYVQNMFPEIDAMHRELYRKADMKVIRESIKKVESLTREDWEKFHEK